MPDYGFDREGFGVGWVNYGVWSGRFRVAPSNLLFAPSVSSLSNKNALKVRFNLYRAYEHEVFGNHLLELAGC